MFVVHVVWVCIAVPLPRLTANTTKSQPVLPLPAGTRGRLAALGDQRRRLRVPQPDHLLCGVRLVRAQAREDGGENVLA